MLEYFDFKQIREIKDRAEKEGNTEELQRIDNDLNGSGYVTNDDLHESSLYDADGSGL